MTKMKLMVIGLTLVSSSLTAQARLGETLQESITRYGQPVVGPTQNGPVAFYGFRKGDWTIGIGFINDKTVMIKYTKSDSSSLSGTESHNLLKIEGDGSESGEWMLPGSWKNHMYKTEIDIMLLTNKKSGHVCKLEDGRKGMLFLDGKTYGKQLTDAFDRKVDQKRQSELEKQKGF